MSSYKREQGGRAWSEPVDVVDGMPDHSRHAGGWHYAAIAVVFVAWLAFLMYCRLAGAQ